MSSTFSGRVVASDSPWKFYVRPRDRQDAFEKLAKRLRRRFEDRPSDVDVVDPARVVVKNEGAFFRAKRLANGKFFLHDVGKEVEDVKRVFNDDEEAEDAFCIRCQLKDVRPFGGRSSWSDEAKRLFAKAMMAKKSVDVMPRSDRDVIDYDGSASKAVELLFEESVIDDPVAKAKKRTMTASSFLIRNKMAEASYAFESDFEEENEEDAEPLSASLSEMSLTYRPPSEVVNNLISSWRRPFIPPREATFSARVVYVSDLGQLYVVSDADWVLLRQIRSHLQVKFDKLAENDDIKLDFKIGSALIAHLPNDDVWFRAHVIKDVNNAEVAVLAIDEGGFHRVRKSDCRAAVVVDEVPAFDAPMLATRVVLKDVDARQKNDRNEWQMDLLKKMDDMILYSKSKHHLEITVLNYRGKPRLPVPVTANVFHKKLPLGDLSTMLVENGIASKTDISILDLQDMFDKDAAEIRGTAESDLMSRCSMVSFESSSSLSGSSVASCVPVREFLAEENVQFKYLHEEDDEKMFAHLLEDKVRFKNFKVDIARQIGRLKPSTGKIYAGAIVAVSYLSEDQFWRARVTRTDAAGEVAWVFLIDYGKLIVKKIGEIYELPSLLLFEPLFGLYLVLDNKPDAFYDRISKNDFVLNVKVISHDSEENVLHASLL